MTVRSIYQFYVDEGAVRDAIRRTSSFNIIHLDTMYKIDVFICGEDPLELEEFARAKEITIDPETRSTLLLADAADIAKNTPHGNYRLYAYTDPCPLSCPSGSRGYASHRLERVPDGL